ncbi:hypothetical protein [Pandoraea sputorum]|uniref:hypothetical protein n=1 Tax=Pandoraea sputorum TaxID=93222 RepID=UPI0030C6C41F
MDTEMRCERVVTSSIKRTTSQDCPQGKRQPGHSGEDQRASHDPHASGRYEECPTLEMKPKIASYQRQIDLRQIG